MIRFLAYGVRAACVLAILGFGYGELIAKGPRAWAEAWKPKQDASTTLYSRLETIDVATKTRKTVYVVPEHFEAPNWTRDGAFFLFNQDGRIYRLPVAGGKPEVLDTGFAIRCNNDHGISPDGKFIAISDQMLHGGSEFIAVDLRAVPGDG